MLPDITLVASADNIAVIIITKYVSEISNLFDPAIELTERKMMTRRFSPIFRCD